MPINGVNPMQLIQMIKGGVNPQQLAMSMLEQRAQGNPAFQNLYSMAKDGRTNEIESFARNVFREQGRDFDSEFSNFKKNFFC